MSSNTVYKLKQVDPLDYKSIAPLGRYLHRIGAEQRNFRRFVVKQQHGRYHWDVAVIHVDESGTIKCDKAEFAPTEAEQDEITEEFANRKIVFPGAINANHYLADEQRRALGLERDYWFTFFDTARDGVKMCQQRIEKDDGTKMYVPWTYFNDNTWRAMEPDGLLPLWKPPGKRHLPFIMLHEGAKAARFVDNLCNNTELQWVERAARHPWIECLRSFEHWGWIGGAHNPHRVDWDELRAAKPDWVVLACDNDNEGLSAAGPIAQVLRDMKQVRLSILRFDPQFPLGFDLADEWPAALYKDKDKDKAYIGPRFWDMICSGTWATKEIAASDGKKPRNGKKQYRLRSEFIGEWQFALRPPVFVNKLNPAKMWTEEEFNNAVRPFSDVSDVASLLRKEIACQNSAVTYEPGIEGFNVSKNRERAINTWRPTPIRPRGYQKGEDQVWLDYMVHLVPDEAERKALERWCATLIARPDIRMKYGVLLIQTMQGVGKSTLMEKILAPLVGWDNCSVPTDSELASENFNHWQGHRRLVLSHEIYQGESRRVYDRLKSAVTEETVEVNEKNVKPYKIKSWAHIMAASNSTRPLYMAEEDRRWLVIQVTEDKKDREYWAALNAWLIDGGLEIIHQWAINYVKEFGPVPDGAEAPRSKTKDKLIEDSKSEGHRLVQQLAEIAMLSVEERRKIGEERGIDPVSVAANKSAAALPPNAYPMHRFTPRFEEKPEPIFAGLTADVIVLTDRRVREWLAAQRDMRLNDPRLESLATIRKVLKTVGMKEARLDVRGGTRKYFFVNKGVPPEIKLVETAPEHLLPNDGRHRF